MSTDVMPVVRKFQGESEMDALVDLLVAVADHDGEGISISVSDIRREWVDDEPGWIRDCRVWDSGDRLEASFGAFTGVDDEQARVQGSFDVHPTSREPAFVDEVVTAFCDSAARLVGRPGRMIIGSRSCQLWKRSALERAGFTVARYFFRMSKQLDEPIADPALPAGFEIRPLDPDRETEQWVVAMNRGFADHYEHMDETVEQKRSWMTYPGYLPEVDLVLVDDRGMIIGIGYNTRERLVDGTERGWVDSLAIVPEFRGRGFGRALLLASLSALKRAGLGAAQLAVDSENASGALGLYESAGFKIDHQIMVYGRDFDQATEQ